MITITQEGSRVIAEHVKEALESKAPLKETLENLYLNGLPDKTINQARLMTDRIFEVISEYSSNCEEALKNISTWLDSKLDTMLEGRSLQEQYTILVNLYAALTLADAKTVESRLLDEGFSVEDKYHEIQSGLEVTGEVTQEDLDELRSKLTQVAANCSILVSDCDALADNIDSFLVDGDKPALDFAANAAATTEYKALASMIAYISAKNGSLPEISPETSIEEITVGVCAAVEREKVISQVENGELSHKTAKAILLALGTAAVLLLYTIAVKTIPLAISIVTGSMFGSAFAMIIGGFVGIALTIYITAKAVNWITENGEDTIERGIRFAQHTWSQISKGYRNMAEYVRGTAIPKIVDSVKSAWEFITSLIKKGLVKIINFATSTQKDEETDTVKA